MSAEVKKEIELEIAHVLFLDIVGYSKLSVNEQHARVEELNETVRLSEQFRKAEAASRLLKIPTGDGMALVFYKSPEEPAHCAVEISRALKDNVCLQVRMGIHSGPVSGVIDVNQRTNVAGAGVNMARRVMDCGDAGHILLSHHVAEDLAEYEHWRPLLHDIGTFEVKHGVRVSVTNLYSDQIGNPQVPTKLQAVRKHRARVRWAELAVGLLLLCAIGAGAYLVSRRPAHSAPAIPEKSIAVMPFQNLSRDPDNAYFADGIQDEILTRLAKIADLKVISRSSTQKYKDKPDNLREVGQQLGVANLLEGSVQKIADAVHINVQLLRAASDEHIWAEGYNRKLDDVFAVEAEVATTIANQLNAKLTGTEQKAIADKPTQNSAAYDAYLRGLSVEHNEYSFGAPLQPATDYAEAVRLDPTFALAWARLAMTRSVLYLNRVDLNVNTSEAVKEAADRAMALAPESGESWIALGSYRYRVLWDFESGLAAYQEAGKRLPNSALVFQSVALVQRRLGRWKDAEVNFKKALDLDPRDVGLLSTIGYEFYSLLRRFDDALAMLNGALEISPDLESVRAAKASVLQSAGRVPEAAQELARIPANSTDDNVILTRIQQALYQRQYDDAINVVERKLRALLAGKPLGPNATFALINSGYCYAWSGRPEEARRAFVRAIHEVQATPDSVMPEGATLLGLAYAGLGEKEKALEQARRGLKGFETDAQSKPVGEMFLAQVEAQVGDHDAAISALPHLLEVPAGLTITDLKLNPMWDPLRNDPRFQKLCEAEPK